MKMNGEEIVMHSQHHRRANRSKSVPSMYSNSSSQDSTEIQPLRLRSGTDSGQRLIPSIRSKARLSSGGLLRSQSKKRRSINGLEKSRSVDLHDERNNSTTATFGECFQSGDENHHESDVFPRRKHDVFSVNNHFEKRDIDMDVQGDFHGDRQGEQTVFVEEVCETESSDVGEQQQPLNDDTELEFSQQNTDLNELQRTEQIVENKQKQEYLTDRENIEEQIYNNVEKQEDFSQFRKRSLPVKLSKHDTGLNINYLKGQEQFKHVSTDNTTTCEEQELRKYNSMPSHLNKDNFDVDLLRNESNNTADKLKHQTPNSPTDTLKPDDNFNESHENLTPSDQFYMSGERLADVSQSLQCIPNENTTTSEHRQIDKAYSSTSAQKVITHDKQLEKLAVTSHSVTEQKVDKPVNNSLARYKRAKPKRQRRTKSLPALLVLEEVPEDKEEDGTVNLDKSLEDVARLHVNKALNELLRRISRDQAKKTRKRVRRTHSLSTIHERQLEENEQLNDQCLQVKVMEEKNDSNDNVNESTSNDFQLTTRLDDNIMENGQSEHAVSNNKLYENNSTTELNDRKENRRNEEQCNNVENVNHAVEENHGSYNEHVNKTEESTREERKDAKTPDNENEKCEDARKKVSSRDIPREERGEFSQSEVGKGKSEQSEGIKPNEKKKKKKKRKRKKKGKGAQAQQGAYVEEEQPEADGIQADIEGIHAEVDGNEVDLNRNEGDVDRHEEDNDGIQEDMKVIQAEFDSNHGNRDSIQGQLGNLQENRDGIQGDLDNPQRNCDSSQGDLDNLQGNLDGIQGNLDHLQGNRDGIQRNLDNLQGNLYRIQGEFVSSPEDDSILPKLCPESDQMQHESYPDDDGVEAESFPEADLPQVELTLEADGLQPYSYMEDEETQSELRPEDEQSLNELCSEELESYPEDDRLQSEPTSEDDRQLLELIPEDEQQHAELGLEDAQQEPKQYTTGEREESEFLPEDELTHSDPYVRDTQVSEQVVDEQVHIEDNTNITEQPTNDVWFVIAVETQEETAMYEPQQEPGSDDLSDTGIPQISVSQVVVEKSRSIRVDHFETPVAIDEIDDSEHFHSDILEHVRSIDYTLLDTSVPQRPKVLPVMESIEEGSDDLTDNKDDHDTNYTFKRTGSFRRKVLKGNMSLPLENTSMHATKRVTWSEDLIEAKSPDTPMSYVSDFGEEMQEEMNEVIDEEDADNDGNNDVVDGEDNVGQYNKEPQDFDDMVRNVINEYLEPDYNESQSPVHRAVAQGCVEALTELIDDGVDVNADDEHGWPPLHVAMLTNNIKCAAILIEAGANLQQYTDTLINEYYAVRNGVLLYS